MEGVKGQSSKQLQARIEMANQLLRKDDLPPKLRLDARRSEWRIVTLQRFNLPDECSENSVDPAEGGFSFNAPAFEAEEYAG